MKENKSITKNTKTKILSIYQKLANLPEEMLNEDTSELFEGLQKLAREADTNTTENLLSDVEIIKIQPHLRKLWANYEYQREKTWALKIYNSINPSIELERYPVYSFYEKIIPFEFGIANALYKGKVNDALFIGSGPLPLSPILFARTANIRVDGIDVLGEACEISTKLINKLGLKAQMNFYNTDICAMDSIEKYEIIVLATLAGETVQEKLAIFKYLSNRMKRGQILIIRTVHGLRSLLYQEPQLRDLDGFRIHFESKTSNIISRVIVVEKQ